MVQPMPGQSSAERRGEEAEGSRGRSGAAEVPRVRQDLLERGAVEPAMPEVHDGPQRRGGDAGAKGVHMKEDTGVLFPPAGQPVRFDGETYDPARDEARLETQLGRVYECMRDGRWRSLETIRSFAGGSEAAVSARLRDLRKARFGGHVVMRRRLRGGHWIYRLAGRTAEGSG